MFSEPQHVDFPLKTVYTLAMHASVGLINSRRLFSIIGSASPLHPNSWFCGDIGDDE